MHERLNGLPGLYFDPVKHPCVGSADNRDGADARKNRRRMDLFSLWTKENTNIKKGKVEEAT